MKIRLWTFEDMKSIKACINSGKVLICNNNQKKECDEKGICLRWGSGVSAPHCKPCLVTVEWIKK